MYRVDGTLSDGGLMQGTGIIRGAGLVVAATLLATLLVAPVQASEPVRYLDVMFDEVAVTVDIPFGEAVTSQGESQELLFDLYEPVGDDATGRPLYIWAHGSGFRVGSKSSNNPLTDYAQRGWVGMSISYRLRPELPPNAAIGILTEPASVPAAQAAAKDAQHDLQAAVRFARAHADDLGIDPDRIAVGGISAGGIMALMAAFNEDDPGSSGTPGVSSRVAAAVSHAGAYGPVLQGGFPQPGSAPVAMYHGTSDEQVPFPLAPPSCLVTLLMGNVCEFVTFAARTHRTMGTDLALAFLYRHVVATPGSGGSARIDVEDDEVTVVAGVETPIGPGATKGLVVPTDPDVITSETSRFVDYVTNALGL